MTEENFFDMFNRIHNPDYYYGRKKREEKKTKKNNGICPVCGKEVTKGVLYRIEELADRPEGIKPEKTSPFYPVIPLKEILSEILKVGSGSKKVKLSYNNTLALALMHGR